MAKHKIIKTTSSESNLPVEWTKQEREAVGEFVSVISSARPIENGIAPIGEEDPFLYGSTKVNIDFAQAAQLEISGELDSGDEGSGFYDMVRCPMYWKLRDAFVKDAKKGEKYSFLKAVWRAYCAGLMSPDRFKPSSNEK